MVDMKQYEYKTPLGGINIPIITRLFDLEVMNLSYGYLLWRGNDAVFNKFYYSDVQDRYGLAHHHDIPELIKGILEYGLVRDNANPW